MEFTEILVSTKNSITTITLNRPDKLNAWTPIMANEVKRAIEGAGDDKNCKCIIVTGAGRGFCAGADMGGLKDRADGGGKKPIEVDMHIKEYTHDSDYGPDISKEFSGRFAYMYNCPKPIIAMINGACAGIGLIFSLYADLRFVSNEAKLTTAFASRGLIAEHGIASILPKLIGEMKALDLLFSARIFLGVEADTIGLVNKSMPIDELEEYVLKYATSLVEKTSPRSLAVIKRQIRASYSQSFNKSLELANIEMLKSFEESDFKEGVDSFMEKRSPNFKAIGK
jgi:enoyl-CoA hydratase/carnithine racemase